MIESWETPRVLYNFACIAARSGQVERALGYLKVTREAGINVAHMKKDPDLKSLRKHPQFKKLIR